MNAPRAAAALVFGVGVLTGGFFVHVVSPVPAGAQTASPMPMSSAMPAPSGKAPGHAPGHMQMMQMMPPVKSAADRAYMGAMMQMHGGMMRMTLTGNADHDFLVMMVPHHQAAVAMAQTELQYGKDPKVLALAKKIIAAQNAEIQEMQSWLR